MVDGGQRVPSHVVRLQDPQSPDHALERRLAAFVVAVGVVQVRGAVDGHAHEEVVLGQERCPVIVDQGAVGLDRVLDDLSRAPMLFDEVHHVPVEAHSHHRGLAALPRQGHLGGSV